MTFIILALSLLGQDVSSLLKKSDDLLLKAKTLQVTLKASSTLVMGRLTAKSKTEGTIRVKGPAKFRFDVTITTDGVISQGSLISDGETAFDTLAPGLSRRPMKNAAERIAVTMSRLGIHSAAALSLQNPDRDPWEEDDEYIPDLRKLVKWSEIKYAGREKVGEVEAHQLTMMASFRKRAEEADSTAEVAVWLDVKTGLPLKRTVTHKADQRRVTCLETYEGWKIDEELTDEVFVVEKK